MTTRYSFQFFKLRGVISKLFQCLLLILANFTITLSQINFHGRVIDSNNQSGLSGVNLRINDTLVFMTDDAGYFEIKANIQPDTIEASCLGYEKKRIPMGNTSPVLIELQASQFLLGEVVVTAYKSEQKMKDIPGSIYLIPHKNLSVDNDVNIVPALNKVPGIYMHSGTYSTNRLTIRGIGSRTLFGTSKIRAYFDNIPLTSGDGETTLEDIDPTFIDRIEIIKGPSSSLYGAGLGGTILISSVLPESGERKIEYQGTGGSYGYMKNAFIAEAGLKKTQVRLVAGKIHSDGYRDNNRFDRISAGFSGRTQLGKNLACSAIFNYIDLLGQIPSSIDKPTYDQEPASAAPTWKATEGYEEYKKILAGFTITGYTGKHASADAAFFWNYRNAYERRPFNILKENTNAWGTRLNYNYSGKLFHQNISVGTGLEYFEDQYLWQTIENIDKSEGSLFSDNKERRKNVNVFIKSDYTIKSKTIISAGINLNLTNYQYSNLYSIDSIDLSGSYSYGQTWSPRIGISQPITRFFNLYGSISSGFSPPSLAETLTPAGNINPEIKPETGINYEIGGRGLLLGSKLNIDLSIFSLQVKNLLVARRTGDDEFIGVNAGKTSHKGIEASINYILISGNESGKPGLTAFASYTLSDFRFSDFVDDSIDYSGNKLTGVPGQSLIAGLDFSMSRGFYANACYEWVGEIPVNDQNSVFTDAYQLVNLKAGYRNRILKHFTFDLSGIVNNMFNEKYVSMLQVNALSVNNRPPRYYYPGLPRNFYLGLLLGYEF